MHVLQKKLLAYLILIAILVTNFGSMADVFALEDGPPPNTFFGVGRVMLGDQTLYGYSTLSGSDITASITCQEAGQSSVTFQTDSVVVGTKGDVTLHLASPINVPGEYQITISKPNTTVNYEYGSQNLLVLDPLAGSVQRNENTLDFTITESTFSFHQWNAGDQSIQVSLREMDKIDGGIPVMVDNLMVNENNLTFSVTNLPEGNFTVIIGRDLGTEAEDCLGVYMFGNGAAFQNGSPSITEIKPKLNSSIILVHGHDLPQNLSNISASVYPVTEGVPGNVFATGTASATLDSPDWIDISLDKPIIAPGQYKLSVQDNGTQQPTEIPVAYNGIFDVLPFLNFDPAVQGNGSASIKIYESSFAEYGWSAGDTLHATVTNEFGENFDNNVNVSDTDVTLNFSYNLPGSKYHVVISDSSYKPLGEAFFDILQDNQGNNGLPPLSVVAKFDAIDNYIEFTTRSTGVDYSQVNRLSFDIGRILATGTVMNVVGDVIKPVDIQLEEVGGPTISFGSNSLNSNIQDNNTNIMHMDISLPGSSIQADKTYRLTFKEEFLKTLINKIANSIYLDNSNEKNIHIRMSHMDMASGVGDNWIDSAEGQFVNPSNISTTPRPAELKQIAKVVIGERDTSQTVFAKGPMLEYNFDLSGGFSDVSKVGLLIKGTENTGVSDTSMANQSVSVSDGNTVTASSTSINGNIVNSSGNGFNTVQMLLDVSALNLSNQMVTVDFSGAQIDNFRKLIRKYQWGDTGNGNDDTLRGKGSIFAVVYDSQNKIIGWQKINDFDDRTLQYVNPTFDFDTVNGAAPDMNNAFKGYYFGQGVVRPQLRLTYTPVRGASKIVVKGVVKCSDEPDRDFILALYQNIGEGNFSNGLNFSDYSRIDPNNNQIVQTLPDAWASSSQFWPNTIPVNSTKRNTIIINTYGYMQGSLYVESNANNTLQFDWIPDPNDSQNMNEIIGDKFRGMPDGSIGPDSGSVDMYFSTSFHADVSKMTLKLTKNGSDIAVYSNAADKGIVNHSWYNFETQQQQSEQVRLITFERQQGELNDLALCSDRDRLNAAIRYKDDSFSIDCVSDFNGSAQIELDKNPPWPNLNQDSFLGEVQRDGVTYYKFYVRFGDKVSLADINQNKDTYFTLVDITGVGMNGETYGDTDLHHKHPSIVEPYFDNNNVFDPDHPDRISAAVLYFLDRPKPNQAIKFSGIKDYHGNPMNEDRYSHISIQVHVKFYIRDKSGNAMPNASVKMVPRNLMPAMANMSPSDMEALNRNSIYLDSDSKGLVDRWVNPSSEPYYVYAIQGFDSNGRQVNLSVGFEVMIPVIVTTDKMPYWINDFMPANNVSGCVNRGSNTASFKEKLLFIKSDYYDTYMTQYNLSRKFDQSISDSDRRNAEQMVNFMRVLYVKAAETDTAGNFSLYMQPGTYRLIGKDFDGNNLMEPLQAVTVTVLANGTYAIPGTPGISFKAPAVSGTIRDANGKALSNCFIEFAQINGGSYYVTTDDSGVFQGYIYQPGDYYIKTVCSNWNTDGQGYLYIFDINNSSERMGFTLASDGNGGVLTNAINTPFVMPATNTTVTFKMGAETYIGDSYNSIHIVIPDMGDRNIPTKTGVVKMKLPDSDPNDPSKHYSIMDYNIGGYWKNISQNPITFRKDADINPNVTVDLSTFINAYVKMVDEDGNPLSGYNISVKDTENNFWYSGKTNASGKAYFVLNVPAAESHTNGTPNLIVEGYSKDKWYDLRGRNITFEIRTDIIPGTMTHPSDVVIFKPNFKGIAIKGNLDGNGNIPQGVSTIQNGWLNIERTDVQDTQNNKWFGIQITDGVFEATIGQVGQYVVHSVHDSDAEAGNSETQVEFKFDIVSVNNVPKAFLHGTNNQINLSNFILEKVKPNFTGHIYKSMDSQQSGVPFVGNPDPYTGIRMWVIRKDILDTDPNSANDGRYGKLVAISSDGSFSDTLNDSYQYVITRIETPNRQYHYPKGIQVSLTQTNEIVVPKTNFHGVLQDFNGNPVSGITNGGISLEVTVGGQKRMDWLQLDNDGSFVNQYEANTTVTIRSVWYQIGMGASAQQIHIDFNKTVTILSTAPLQSAIVLKPNFKAEITVGAFANLCNNNEYFVGSSVRPIYSSASDLAGDQAAYDRYTQKPWEFEKWLGGTYDPANRKATVYAYLKAGQYMLMNLGGSNKNMDIKQNFSISDENAGASLVIDLTPNVSGVIRENNVGVANAWVNIRKVVTQQDQMNANKGSMDNYYFNTRTDGDGNFGIKIYDDGQYVLDGYNTDGHWDSSNPNNPVWVNGKYVQVGYKFTIENHLLKGITSIDIVPNFLGKLSRLSGNSYVPVASGWVSIRTLKTDSNNNEYVDWKDPSSSYWAQTDSQGNFNMMLGAGRYIVTDAGAQNFWMKSDIKFTLADNGNGVQLVDNPNVLNGKLLVQPAIPNFKGIAYRKSDKSAVLSFGHFDIKPANAADNDWTNVIGVDTDKYGNFSIKIPAGSWKIASMNNNNFWSKMDLRFTVSGSSEEVVTSESANGFEISGGNISIYPPRPNLIGYIKDSNGNIVTDKAWMVIKPVNAEEQDWSNAIWIEYFRHDNDTGAFFKQSLPNGNYKVVDVGGNNFRYRSDITFTVNGSTITSGKPGAIVSNQLVVSPPTPNVSGTVYGKIGGEDQPIPNGWISFARFDDNGNQVKLDGSAISAADAKDINSNIYWQYTIGVPTDSQAKYTLILPTGTYKVVSVNGQGIGYRPMMKFTIPTDTSIDVYQTGPNVTINVQNVPTSFSQGVTDGWLNVCINRNGENVPVPVKFKQIDGSNFVFESNLDAGTYTIQYFGTLNGGIDINQSFTVNSTTSVNVSLGSLVSGVVKNGSSNVTERVWIAIQGTVDGQIVKYKVQTDDTGNFKFKLPAGTIWRVVEISTSAGYMDTSSVSAFTFNSNTPNWEVNLTQIQ